MHLNEVIYDKSHSLFIAQNDIVIKNIFGIVDIEYRYAMLRSLFPDLKDDIGQEKIVAEDDHAVEHIIIYKVVYLDLSAHNVLWDNSVRTYLHLCHKV